MERDKIQTVALRLLRAADRHINSGDEAGARRAQLAAAAALRAESGHAASAIESTFHQLPPSPPARARLALAASGEYDDPGPGGDGGPPAGYHYENVDGMRVVVPDGSHAVVGPGGIEIVPNAPGPPQPPAPQPPQPPAPQPPQPPAWQPPAPQPPAPQPPAPQPPEPHPGPEPQPPAPQPQPPAPHPPAPTPPQPHPPAPQPPAPPQPTSPAAVAAQRIIANPRITLSPSHVSNHPDAANAWQNIHDVAAGRPAARSSYADPPGAQPAPGGSTPLSQQMINALNTLAGTFSFTISEVAGGCHSANSPHYQGLAFDVNVIDGRPVNTANPDVARFRDACSALGGTTLGPGDPHHDTHVHCAFPH